MVEGVVANQAALNVMIASVYERVSILCQALQGLYPRAQMGGLPISFMSRRPLEFKDRVFRFASILLDNGIEVSQH
jgi:hypothetical protein